MCGVFGFTGNIPCATRIILARSLACFNQDRGDDSTGLANISPDRSVSIWKEAIAAQWAVTEAEFAAHAGAPGTLIGHTRYATHGAVTADNAHPWQIGRTVGCHNGCAINTRELESRCGVSYAVDSQYLLHLIDRDGAVGEMRGSAVLTYSRLDDIADVTFERSGNPLAIAQLESGAVVWSSEEAHLERSLAIAGIDDYWTVKCDDGWRIDVIGKEIEARETGIVIPKLFTVPKATTEVPRKTVRAWDIDDDATYRQAWAEYLAENGDDDKPFDDLDAEFWQQVRGY